MENKQQYFGEEELKQIGSLFKLQNLQLISTDTYSDHDVWESIQDTGKAELLLCAALQMCVVGFGNKTYGHFEYQGVKYDVKELFTGLGVKMHATLEDKLSPHDLTPRRIQRFFRRQVKVFLDENTNVKPFLWRKYSTRVSKYRHTTYPGAESYLVDEEEIEYLVQTYEEVDRRNGSKISERIRRVLEARGLSKI